MSFSKRSIVFKRDPVKALLFSGTVDRQYGRPHDGALKECAPSSFTTSGKIQTVCRFMTNLLVKGGIAQLFFGMPHLNLERVLPQGVEEAAVRAKGMDGMFVMVKRRVGIIEQEARHTHDFQADLETARETIATQRQASKLLKS
ncbi:hypothetical protein V1520DRAFT_358582 [Lipomyces starkeyi]